MLGRIIEIQTDGMHLSVHRGFMLVKAHDACGEEIARIPLDDLAAVIAHAHGLSYSNNLLCAFAHRACPFVLCDDSHNVVGMLWPVEGNFEQARRIDAQLACSKPLNKRLWAEVIRNKLAQQAAVLKATHHPDAPIKALIPKVKSGDKENIEAQAAQKYWRLLFGTNFRRDREAPGINGLLNYGYTLLRTATARAVVAAGLHPAIALHHRHANNAMRLVDDLMEPFRPIVDKVVWQLLQAGHTEVSSESKKLLGQSLYYELPTEAGNTPVIVCMQRLATSLAQVYLNQRAGLDLPHVLVDAPNFG